MNYRENKAVKELLAKLFTVEVSAAGNAAVEKKTDRVKAPFLTYNFPLRSSGSWKSALLTAFLSSSVRWIAKAGFSAQTATMPLNMSMWRIVHAAAKALHGMEP